MRRLTNSQYDNTVRDLVKDFSRPASRFPTEDYVNGYKNQYEALSISPVLAEAYGIAAERVAAGAFRRGDSRNLYPCDPKDASPACGKRFVEEFGRLAFRRPLDPQESGDYQQLFSSQPDAARRRPSGHRGDAAIAQLPLLARQGAASRSGSPTRRRPGSPTSFGIRLPTSACWQRPRNGELDTAEGLETRGSRHARQTRGRVDGVDEFVSQWLRFDRVMSASRERRAYPPVQLQAGRAR